MLVPGRAGGNDMKTLVSGGVRVSNDDGPAVRSVCPEGAPLVSTGAQRVAFKITVLDHFSAAIFDDTDVVEEELA